MKRPRVNIMYLQYLIRRSLREKLAGEGAQGEETIRKPQKFTADVSLQAVAYLGFLKKLRLVAKRRWYLSEASTRLIYPAPLKYLMKFNTIFYS